MTHYWNFIRAASHATRRVQTGRARTACQVWCLTALLLGATWGALAQPVPAAVPAARQFSIGALNRLDELPAGPFRTRLEQLPATAQGRALQWLRSFHFPEADVASLHVDNAGGICYVCQFSLPAMTDPLADELEAPPIGQAAVPVSPFPPHLIFHSRPGAANVLYLNFAGETVVNTEWNTVVGRSEIPALPFSSDPDYSTFSDSEQAAIKRIWQRVAEDYAPFNINVTTERPASFNNRTALALITRKTDANGAANPYNSGGGVAYVNVFGTSSYAKYRPAWVYHDNLSNGESFIAEAASHEIGHNLGLSHDGTSGSDYYGGHGSGDISWGPIMGTGYNRNVSQWSKGDYYHANNTQDDLATIAGKLAYRTDDHGGTPGTATALVITGGTNIVATTPENDPANANAANKGVLDRNTDVDVFSFVTGNGPVRLAVNPWIMPAGTRGGNVDLQIELYHEGGALLLTSNPASLTAALIETSLAEGRYYLHVRNSAAGDPFSSTPTGYTAYASIGQYFISGYVTTADAFIVPPLAEIQLTDLTQSGQTTHQFAVTYSDDVAIDVATIDSSDLRVTGPNGYAQYAQFVSLNSSGNGTPRTATYAVTPPGGGTWSPAHNGTYTVSMRATEVADTEVAFVAAGELGQFQIAVATTIYFANMDADPGWTLQPDWQYGPPAYASGGPTSGYTGTKIIGYNLGGNYPNNLSVKYATTPAINTAGSTALTLRFRRWLGVRNIDAATIQASADGVNWVGVWSSAGSGISDNGWQLVQYSLPAGVTGSSSLRLRWGLSSGGSGGRPANIGWNLDDVELLGNGALDTEPPVAVLSVADLAQAGSPSHACSVTYTDATAVSLASLDSTDLLVTGPNGYSNVVEFIGADLPMDGSPITGSYSIPAPDGSAWSAADNGTYTVTLLAGAVADTWNNVTVQAMLGTFEVAISTAAPGVLTVASAAELDAAGPVGGPFSPDSIIYTLSNTGETALDWSASRTAGWLSLSATGGSLAAGASAEVTVSLNAGAASLTAGDYTDSVSFVNTTTGNGNTSRGIQLSVLPLVNLTLTASPAEWGTVSPGSGSHAAGSTVEVQAVPATYFKFLSWSGDASGTTNPLPLTLEADQLVTAAFAEILTTNHPTPHWWLAEQGYTSDFEAAVEAIGSNGLPLWQSYVAGLDPANPASVLRLDQALSPTGDEVILQWHPVAGRLYTIWATQDLTEPFTLLPGATDLPAEINSFTDPLDPGRSPRYYRLEVRKP
jgi:hypothetical protein